MKHKALWKGMLAAFLITAAFSWIPGQTTAVAAQDIPEEDQVYQAEVTEEQIQEWNSLVNHNGGLQDVHFLPENEQLTMAAAQSGNWKAELTQRMSAAFDNGERVIDVSDMQLNADDEDITVYTSQYLNEHPEYFYVRYVYRGEYMRDDNGSYTKIKSLKVRYDSDYLDSNNNPDMQKIHELQAAVENGIENALSVISSEMSDIEKALALHDWVVRECDYDYTNYKNDSIPSISYSYAGVFAKGQAVCQGYAEAMSVLFQKVGIESYVVSSSKMNHAWNVVLLDGAYYHIDATWDDPIYNDDEYEDNICEGFVRHKNFVKSDTEMTQECNHYGWSTTNIPVCDSENSYADYIFRTNSRWSFSYADGSWYYYGYRSGSTRIISSTVDGKNSKSVYTEPYISGLFINDDMIYVCDRHCVYSVSVDTVKNTADGQTAALTALYNLTEKNPGYSLQEFCIKKGILIVNASKADAGLTFEHIRIDLYADKTPQKRVVVYPAKKTYEAGEALNTAGVVVYDAYGNGIIRMLNGKKITVSGYNADTVGKQTLQVLYNQEKVGSYTVNVQVALKGISLNVTNAYVKEGNTTKLTVVYNPSNTTVDKTVTWSSSNPAVASVDADGVVTGLKYGTVTITARVGSYIAECRVAVQEAQHAYTARVTKEATCTEYGVIRYTCSNCGSYYTETISPLGHDYGEWYIRQEATCTQAGLKVRNCKRCNAEETETIPQKSHSVTEIAGREATCTQAGSTGGKMCLVCGIILEQPTTVEALGHTGGAADCTHLAVCDRCGQPYGAYAENVHNHTSMINVREASYEQNGYTGDTICQDCGKVLSFGQSVPALKKDDTQDTTSGWKEVDGVAYWYENGVRQGYDPENPSYRGKEIFDPSTNAWYWLDNVQMGAVAKDKDVYQESYAGAYADRVDGTGKWVRYDADGKMIKGEDYRYGGWYRFDQETGAMVKGWYTAEDGTVYYYSKANGQMEHGFVTIDNVQYLFDEATGARVDGRWYTTDGNEYWYEGGIRQGTEGRGKEIYDDASKAWYWLDAVDGGKKTVSKDVYQESYAGQFADRADGTGKWVRYDENGHMIKGFDVRNGNEVYYFDEQTGAMAKGTVVIKGVEYYFNPATGICERSTIL